MQIKPFLEEEIGRGKSGFAVNRDAVNRGFTVYSTNFSNSHITRWYREQYQNRTLIFIISYPSYMIILKLSYYLTEMQHLRHYII